jgi:predicted metalloprotease
VQDLLGTNDRVGSATGPKSGSVRLELQADCYAGVWGHSAAQRNKLDPGDVQEGLQAAAAVGDDRLQRMSTGSVDADSFTHGTSEQRMQWFSRGFESGDPRTCDTFGAAM